MNCFMTVEGGEMAFVKSGRVESRDVNNRWSREKKRGMVGNKGAGFRRLTWTSGRGQMKTSLQSRATRYLMPSLEEHAAGSFLASKRVRLGSAIKPLGQLCVSKQAYTDCGRESLARNGLVQLSGR